MDGINQLNIFFVCALTGFAGGIVYEPFGWVHKIAKGVWPGLAADVLFFLAFSAFCIAAAALFALPDFRVYMYLGNLLGLILYWKSIHRILDFSQKVCYNSIRKVLKRRKSTKNSGKKEVQAI